MESQNIIYGDDKFSYEWGCGSGKCITIDCFDENMKPSDFIQYKSYLRTIFGKFRETIDEGEYEDDIEVTMLIQFRKKDRMGGGETFLFSDNEDGTSRLIFKINVRHSVDEMINIFKKQITYYDGKNTYIVNIDMFLSLDLDDCM